MKSGQTLVEFTIGAAITILVLIGLMELGRYLFTVNTLSNSVREGARYAIVHRWDDIGIRQRVLQSLTGVNREAVNVQISFDPPTRTSGSLVTVTATYPFRSATGIFQRSIVVSATMKVP